MKRILILLVAALFMVACGSGEDENTTDELKQELKEKDEELQDLYTEQNKQEDEPEVEDADESEDDNEPEVGNDSQDIESDINWDVNNVVDADLDDVSITDLRINEDASVDEERYIVLVDLEWDVKNKPSTTKDMLDMYSDHLAAKLSDNELIHDLVLFWTVPYHNENESILKRTYENQDEGMYLEDEMKDITVFD